MEKTLSFQTKGNLIEECLKNHIKEQNAVFVFPTQMAADLWADRITEVSDVTAVAMERFLAWDSFKGTAIRGRCQDKKSVPSIMRAIFVENLLKKNAENPFFKNLIPAKYASNAAGFTDWISSLLPSLALWKHYFDAGNVSADDEDADLLLLYKEYSAFLDNHGLFDPAWETPPFEPNGNHYYIFFPEILSDYYEYEAILKSTKDITIINLDETSSLEASEVPVYFFKNARYELRNIMLHLLDVHKKGISWDEIAISVPDMDSYGSYLERELSLHEIPYIMQYAKPLASSGAGNLFSQINECVSSDFSYDSLKNFLLNSELPWKDARSVRQLINFGQKNHCICSFSYNNKKVDVWKESFSESTGEEIAATFYSTLTNDLKSLVNARTFAEIRERYFVFRNDCFDMSLCSKKSDLILSRCVSELAALIDLEAEFGEEAKVSSPFQFFVKQLSSINYLEQAQTSGVHVIPYRMGATAPFKCHVILDASQAALSVVYKELGFLRDDKRVAILKREDPNVTEKFLRLYQMNSTDTQVYFTASSKTFTGYAQSVSCLKEVECGFDTEQNNAGTGDIYKKEKNWIGNEPLKDSDFPCEITASAKNSFTGWKNAQAVNTVNTDANAGTGDETASESSPASPNSCNDFLTVSESQLKVFYDCPRKWYFQRELNLEEEINAAELMNMYAMGDLNHKILELYCKNLRKQNIPVHYNADEYRLEDNYVQILETSIDAAITGLKDNSFITKELLFSTRSAIFRKIYKAVLEFSRVFNGCNVKENEGWYSLTKEQENYKINGQIDCLLSDPQHEDEYILVDFKSSASGIPSKNLYADGEELPDFQIPLYVYLLRQTDSRTQLTVENACFYNLKECKFVPVFGNALGERLKIKPENVIAPERFEPTIQKTLECVDFFIQNVRQGKFSPSDEAQDYEKCFGCKHSAVCRRTFTVCKGN